MTTDGDLEQLERLLSQGDGIARVLMRDTAQQHPDDSGLLGSLFALSDILWRATELVRKSRGKDERPQELKALH